MTHKPLIKLAGITDMIRSLRNRAYDANYTYDAHPLDLAARSRAIGSAAAKVKPNRAFRAAATKTERLGIPTSYGSGWIANANGDNPMCNALMTHTVSSAIKQPGMLTKPSGRLYRVNDINNAIKNNDGVVNDTRFAEIPYDSMTRTPGSIVLSKTHTGVTTDDGNTAHASYTDGAVKNRWGYKDHPKTGSDTKYYLTVPKEVTAGWARAFAASKNKNKGSYIPPVSEDITNYYNNSPRFRRMSTEARSRFIDKVLKKGE